MKNDVEPDFLNQLDTVFAQLNPRAVEEFYVAYRQWCLRQRITELRHRIDAVREQQAHNQQRLGETRPTTIALAALARLQSNGVSDIPLLDAMLERGESWLDQTMQRLDYFEQFDDFISDDYTKWCQGALEGAFDWIDSLLESTGQTASPQLETPPAEEMPHNQDAGDVEALLLQRLATEDEKDDLSWQEATTLKRTAIKASTPESVTTQTEEQEAPTPEDRAGQETHETERPADASPGPFIVETEGEEEEDPSGRLHTSDAPENAGEPAATDPSELSLPEETTEQGAEQSALTEIPVPEKTFEQEAEQSAPTEIPVPEDAPAIAETDQSEANEADEIEDTASDEDVHHEQQAPSRGETIMENRSIPQKRGMIRSLIWIFTGK